MERFDISEDTPTLLDDLLEDGQDRGPAEDKAEERIRLEHIGYRWIASRVKDACPKCAALHDKVFYKHPEPGQASVDDMPKGQLHPNCGCTKKPVIGLEAPDKDNRCKSRIKPYMEGQVECGVGGLLFRKSNLNSRGMAIIYGRYGGDFWTGGRDTSHDSSPDPHAYDAPGEDDLDEIFKNHDLCYDTNGRDSLECDKTLYHGLRSLDPDPRNWSNPPQGEDEIEYAKDYRRLAILSFYFKIRYGELDNVILDDIEQGSTNTL